MKELKIYTRGGDSGETSMLSGERVSKADPHITAVGDLDELSVALGFCRVRHSDRAEFLKEIQQRLYQLSALVSYSGEKHADKFTLPEGATQALESMIDDVQNTLPPLKEFIYPGNTLAGCALHQARVVARRVERNLAVLPIEKRNAAIPYINRLSDALFVLAREADMQAGAAEEGYRAGL